MSSPRTILIRGLTLGVLAALLVAGALIGYVLWYTHTDKLLPGIRIGEQSVGGLGPREAVRRLAGGGVIQRPPIQVGGTGAAGGQPVEASAGQGPTVGRPGTTSGPPALELRVDGKRWLLDRTEVGPAPDWNGAVRQAETIGREGSVLEKVRAYLTGLVHGHRVPVPAVVPDEPIRSRLEEIAREIRRDPVNATYDFQTDTLTPEADGLELDVEASSAVVRRALLLEQSSAELVVRPVTARVRREDLASVRQYQVARFTTPILAADPGRVHNIAMAVKKISGVILKPGETFSFNDRVGPRDKENGWAQAKELYQGEFVLGYGGGICQVSSTLYNSVLLAGLEVTERYHHDRPLSYVRPGRDATVAWKVLDFRFRNSASHPVLLGARILPGQPQHIEVTVYAQQPPAGLRVSLEESDVHYIPAPLVEVMDATLPAGKRIVVDEGHYGIEIKIYRIFGEGAQQRRELVSHDRYHPKPGKVRVGAGNAPGSPQLIDPGLQ